MSQNREDNKLFFIVAFVVLLTRIPFLFAGYGSEEDAWGLILIARKIDLSGIYEVSRFPGHPIQEYFLTLIWNWPSWLLNLLTATISSAGVFFFMKTLRHLNIKNVIPSAIALAFVPVFYINSTNVMDYNWALSLVLLAFYFTVTGKYQMAGVIIGIACGFRITAGAMVIPFAIWHYMTYKSIKTILLSVTWTVLTAIICFLPAWNVYGGEFFTYYEYFPYPPVLKNIYKATVGAWGVPGTIAVMTALVSSAVAVSKSLTGNKRGLKQADSKDQTGNRELAIVLLCISAIVLYTIAFLKIPQKSAFVLPMVPFIILLFALFLTRKQLIAFSVTMVVSCFFFGINLDDPLRGSKPSVLAYQITIGNTPVVIDILSGTVMADLSKRKQKIAYAKSVVDAMYDVREKTVILAGWWQNELNYFALKKKNPFVSYLYYADESQLSDSISTGCKIYFLPEQDYYNDLRFQSNFTKKLAMPF